MFCEKCQHFDGKIFVVLLENIAKTYLFLIFVFRCGGGMKKASQ